MGKIGENTMRVIQATTMTAAVEVAALELSHVI